MERTSLLKAGFMLWMAAHVLPLVSGCNRSLYERTIHDLCLANFRLDLGGLDPGLWCSWPDTMKIYEDLTNCTHQVAHRVGCFCYFHNCALTGRLIHDPPPSILAPFISPSHKRTEGVL
uniref:Receptor activity-modifying protein 1 n=1 Tax=Takifugu rubripes TaxID=31033 RepID=A0A674NFY0_TAKRU